MKKILLPFIALALLAACNSGGEEKKVSEEQQLVDSLWNKIDDAHMVGMKKMPKLSAVQNSIQKSLDSISKLPAKAKQAAAGAKEKLDTLLKQVEYANFAMDKWMKEFKFDIEKEYPDIKQRIEYLKSEEIKVEKMKEAIESSLGKADTVLKKIF
ncbi:MAG TPA: lipoprotein [Chitinophagaceae bacterium]|nr:lipoprotein [Chitinophagaceae bacterium]